MRFFRKNTQPQAKAGASVMAFQQKTYAKKDQNNAAYIKDGYEQNIIIYRAINEICNACASIDLEVWENDVVKEQHEVLDLIRKPNATQSFDDIIKAAMADYNITGNTYILGSGDAKPMELYVLPSKDVEIEAGKGFIPASYKYDKNVVFSVDSISGNSRVFHHKTYNPSDIYYGMSPLKACSLSADMHNAGLQWNWSLLKNGACPTGIFEADGMMDENSYNRLKKAIETDMAGFMNGGKPLLLEGVKFNPISSNAKDMDFLALMKETAKYVSSALGVPIPLIDNDASTFNNIEQSRERLWTDTVFPLMDSFLQHFNQWLNQWWPDVCVKMNKDNVPAIEAARQRKFDRLVAAVNAGLISIDEARIEMGYEPIGGLASELIVATGRTPISFVADAAAEI